MHQLLIRLLGPPEIRFKDQLIKIPRRRSRALLFYMVCTHTPQPRERLLALLCGEMDDESARHSFKTLLAEVRAQLRSLDATVEWIIGDGDQLTLNPLTPLWLDTEIFETAAATAARNLTQAIKLYRGVFLDGFFLKDAPNFDTWMRSTRDHFHHLYISALRRLAEIYESDEQISQAIACTHMLVTADPLSEEAYARLMRLYWMSGERVAALRQYEKLCAVLAKELAVMPMATTQTLYEEIAHSTSLIPITSPLPPIQPQRMQLAPSPHPSQSRRSDCQETSTTPFIGRTKELSWLCNHLLYTEDAPTLLHISGTTGIGKTRLIRAAIQQHCSSWLILYGACQEIERKHPYHAVIAALREGLQEESLTQLNLPRIWFTEIAQLIPDLFQLETTLQTEKKVIEPTILANALVALLNQLAQPQRPVLFVLDDIHWADNSTLALLGHLACHVQAGSVFLLGTSNSHRETQQVIALRSSVYRQKKLAELTLAPLQPQDITEIAVAFSATMKQRASEDQIVGTNAFLSNWCYQRSRGNPFLALEWLHFAVEKLTSGENLSDTLIPAAIRAHIQMQLKLLTPDAIALLEAAASLGLSFNLFTAAALIGFDKRVTVKATKELLKHAFITILSDADPACCSFTHWTVRDVIIDMLNVEQQHFLHKLVSYSALAPSEKRVADFGTSM
ncbi:MAG: hypothetical protein NVSMB33_09920 [Ktedonobacteraceae bacterium]